MRLDVALEVHAHEAVELEKARIDVAHEAGIWKRHLGDDVAAEPVGAALFGELVHRGRIDARIDRPAHQHHGSRHIRIVVRLHERDRGHDRHRRLAHRDHMGVAAERVQDRNHVVDVIVEIEAPFRQRHHARIHPVGDVDIVIGQERLDGAAQQRREWPDIGATISSRGCGRCGWCSNTRSKWMSRQNGRSQTVEICTGTRSPPTSVDEMPPFGPAVAARRALE